MARKFLVPIGLVSLSSDPAGTSAGQTYYNTTSNKIRIYNGTSWIDAGVSAQELSDAIGASVLDNTDDLTEGSTNLYYTDTRVGTYITNNLVSLQGTQGVQGIQGIIGTQGIVSGASAPANQGILWLDTTAAAQTGPQGTTGTQGATGAQGTTGTGTQGTTGTTGAQGATGAQGTTGAGTQGTTGAQGSTGTQGITGQNGNFGGASFDYTYSTTTAAADPGAGKIRFNNATITSATAMYIDSTNDAATDLSSFLNTIDDSTSTIKGHFRVSAKFDDSIFALFTISSLVDQTGWFTVNGSYVSGNGSFSDLADTVITFARTGDQGETGAQGATGSQGVQGITGSQGLTGLQGVVSSETAPVAQSVLWLDTTAAAQTGPQGMTGGTGMTGAQGAQGATGPAVVTTKGDLATFSTVVARLPIGANNTVLTADSAEATGIKWAAPASPTYVGASLYKTTVQSINNGSDVTVTWDAEYFDTNAIHDNVTNNSRLTIPTGYSGKWLVNFSQSWAAASTGAKWSYIYKNGSTDVFGTFWTYTSAGSQVKQSASCVLNLTAGDYLTVVVGQNSGGALNLAADYATSIMISYLGA